jgi:hypothetical protein
LIKTSSLHFLTYIAFIKTYFVVGCWLSVGCWELGSKLMGMLV